MRFFRGLNAASGSSLTQWANYCMYRQNLTHWGRVTQICASKLTMICSDNALSAPSHYLNQCWNIVNWTLGNKFQWNPNRNWYIFIQEIPFENVVWKMVAILSRPRWASMDMMLCQLPLWCNGVRIISALLAFCERSHCSPVDPLTEGQ